jgi:hypothetical protein
VRFALREERYFAAVFPGINSDWFSETMQAASVSALKFLAPAGGLAGMLVEEQIAG